MHSEAEISIRIGFCSFVSKKEDLPRLIDPYWKYLNTDSKWEREFTSLQPNQTEFKAWSWSHLHCEQVLCKYHQTLSLRVTLPSFHFSKQLMEIMLLQHCCLKKIKPVFAELFLPLRICFSYTCTLSLLLHDCSRKHDSMLKNETTVHTIINRNGNSTGVSTIEQRKRKIGNHFLVL